MKHFRLLSLGMLSIALVWTRPVAAQARGPKPLLMAAHNVTAEAAGRDNKGQANPGDVIRYALVFKNTTAGAVKNVELVDPLPKGMVYIVGSAGADRAMRVEYSIDGGKSYTARPVVQVVADGQKVEQAAPREMYTHVRWTLLGSLAPGSQVTAELEAQVSGQVNGVSGEAK
ncbi:MAG TPA: hypothetical protein VIW28_07745 [Gemmatimonadales bacterium]